MTLEEAIKHCEEIACNDSECANEHQQLAEWLKELQAIKSLPLDAEEAAREYAKSKHSDVLLRKIVAYDFLAGVEWCKAQEAEEPGLIDYPYGGAVENADRNYWGDGNML